MARNKLVRKLNQSKALNVANKEISKTLSDGKITKKAKQQLKKETFLTKIQTKYEKKQLNSHTTDKIEMSTESLLKQYNDKISAPTDLKPKPKQKKTPKLSVLEKNTHANINSLDSAFGNIF